jgi:hypothetical protein
MGSPMFPVFFSIFYLRSPIDFYTGGGGDIFLPLLNYVASPALNEFIHSK